MDGALIIAKREGNNGAMLPVSKGGRLVTFPTIRAARRAAGPLGVGVAITPARARQICRRHGLGLPDLRQQVKQAKLL